MRILGSLVTSLFVTCASLVSQTTSVSVTQFGAVGDGTTLNTVALQKAIDACWLGGGGTVDVPAGVYLTGTLELRSNVDLHLEPGSVIRGSPRLEDYQRKGRRVGLLFTQDAQNVSITGSGTIDGNGDSYMELGNAKKLENAGVTYTRQRENFRKVEQGLGDGPVVPKDRPYQMLIFSDCRNVSVSGILITNSPFWTLHFADCDGVIVSGVRIFCNLLVPNNDGVDITSCSNVLMSDCDIRTGDDCIAVTGYAHHFDLPGYKELRHPCENITVSNCLLVSRSAAIRIGGFDQNPMRNMTFNNITITNSNRGIGIFARDEGGIENLIFSNMIIETRLLTGDWWGCGEPIHLSAVRLTKDVPLGKVKNIKFQNIVCRGESGMIVYAGDESAIEDVSFDDVRFHIADSRLNDVAGGNFDLRPALDPKEQLFAHEIPGLYARNVKNLRVRDFDLTWDPVKQPFFTHGIEVNKFDGLTIEGFTGTAAPGNSKAYPVSVSEGKGFRTDAKGGAVLRTNVKSE